MCIRDRRRATCRELASAAQPTASRSVPSETIEKGIHSQAGRAAKTAGHRNARRQNRTESGGRGTECNLRGGFPRVFVRIPAQSERAWSTGCAGGGNRTSESELCARCRHPRFLRNHRSRMDDEIHRAPDCGREDAEADSEVAQRRSGRGRSLDGDDGGSAARLSLIHIYADGRTAGW